MKVFGIGLHRTGTRSLSSALEVLGFRVIHYPDDPRTEYELRSAGCVLSVLRDHDALTDLPAAAFYRELDRAYPGSKFILTVRQTRPWLQSIRRHLAEVENIGWPAEKQQYDKFLLQRIYGQTTFDASRFAKRLESHSREVVGYFRNRSNDFLAMSICGGDGWGALCDFLGMPVPDRLFPWDR